MSIRITAVLTFDIPMTDPELVAAYETIEPAAVANLELGNLDTGDYLAALIGSDLMTGDRYEVTVTSTAGQTATAASATPTNAGDLS